MGGGGTAVGGGTGGIGAAFAEAFLQAGAVVTIVDIAPPRADQSSGLKYEQVDMGDDAAVAALAARTDHMDVVIHCAGRAAIGEEDSPIANRGCVPFSMSTTERPARRAIIASNEPANPEPTIPMS